MSRILSTSFSGVLLGASTIVFSSCGAIGFGNNTVNGVRQHNQPRVNIGSIELDNVQAYTLDDKGNKIPGTFEFDLGDSYKAELAAKTQLDTTQSGVTAENDVKVKLAVSKYLTAFLTSGGSLAADEAGTLLKAAVSKAKAGAPLSEGEELAVAIAPNELNGNTQPPKAIVEKKLADFAEAASDKTQAAAAEALLKELSKKEVVQ